MTMCSQCLYRERCLQWACRRCPDFKPDPGSDSEPDLLPFERAFASLWREPVDWTEVRPAVVRA